MGDLTSRSALIKRMNEYVFDAFDCDGIDAENVLEYQQTHNDNSTYIIQGFNDVYELLEDIPTVDAVPVIHGEWVPNESEFYVCSVCDSEAYWDTDYGQQLFDYCPYCGAKMDGKKVEE